MAEAGGEVSPLARALYYVVLFFAYWFGSSRFDFDGDGDFDPTDVQAYLADEGNLARNFRQSRTSKIRRSRASAAAGRGSTETGGRWISGSMERGLSNSSVPGSPASAARSPKGGSRSPLDAYFSSDASEASRAAASVAPPDAAASSERITATVSQGSIGASEAGSVAGAQPTQVSSAVGILDRDRDGEVNFNDMAIGVSGVIAEEDEIAENLFDRQLIPWFILLECAAVVILWVIFALVRYVDTGDNPLLAQAGLDNLAENMTDLRVADGDCTDRRPEVWRWFTYQFTHIGLVHVFMNVFLNVMLGIPLEGLHGSFRMFVMYNIGVLGGSLCYFVADSHTFVVGCSGGCYALIGINFADLIVNWGQKKFRIPTLVFLSMLVTVDVISYVASLSDERVSHSAHVGGLVAGLIIGCLIGKNLKMHRWEKVISASMAVVGLAFGIFSIAWLFRQSAGPKNIWESAAGEPGWCWVKQIYSRAIDPTRFVCVRCGTPACVEEWGSLPNVSSVSARKCMAQGFYYDGR